MDRQPRIPAMTIKDINGYVRTLWNWDCLVDCFGNSKIMPSDIDGFVERNGRFLVIETKSPGTELLPGQARAYSSRSSWFGGRRVSSASWKCGAKRTRARRRLTL